MGAELFHANGQTDKIKLTVAFRSFENSSNKRPTSFVLAKSFTDVLNDPCDVVLKFI